MHSISVRLTACNQSRSGKQCEQRMLSLKKQTDGRLTWCLQICNSYATQESTLSLHRLSLFSCVLEVDDGFLQSCTEERCRCGSDVLRLLGAHDDALQAIHAICLVGHLRVVVFQLLLQVLQRKRQHCDEVLARHRFGVVVAECADQVREDSLELLGDEAKLQVLCFWTTLQMEGDWPELSEQPGDGLFLGFGLCRLVGRCRARARPPVTSTICNSSIQRLDVAFQPTV